MIMIRRGLLSTLHSSSTEWVPTTWVPLASSLRKSSTFDTVRLNTATLYPWSFMFKTRFCPITASPINPISQFASATLAFPLCIHPATSTDRHDRVEGVMIPDQRRWGKERGIQGRHVRLYTRRERFHSRVDPGFPVELIGFHEMHALFRERRTRDLVQCR